MIPRCFSLAALGVLAAPVAAPAWGAADVLAPGFQSSTVPYPLGPAGAAIRNLSDGSVVTSDGFLVQRWLASGTYAGTIGGFSSPGAPGAFEVDPTESFVLAGNATSGEMILVHLFGLGQTTLPSLPNNRDAAFESPTSVIVSAATCGKGCGNALVRVNLVSGAATTLAAVDGESGPVALDNSKDLFYGTVSAGTSPAPGSSALLRFSGAALASPPPGAFQASAGIVVIEVETSPPNGDWNEYTSLAGFTGTSYYRWDGSDHFSSPGSGILSYPFEVTEAGNYQFNYHNRHDNPAPDQSNDAWVRVDGGTWLKVFSNQGSSTVGVWNWHSIAETASGAQFQANYDLSAGPHVVEISGRSNGFMIDRMVFFRSYVASPFDLGRPQSIFAPFNQADAATVVAGFDGATDLAHEPEQDLLFLAENNAAAGTSRLVRVSQQGDAIVYVEGSPFQTIANLDYTPLAGIGVFHPFQPADSGALSYTRVAPTVHEHRVLHCRRPELRFSGPGAATGAGPVLLTVQGAAPSGLVFLCYAPAAAASPVELSFFSGGTFPLLTAIPPAAATLLLTPLVCTSAGDTALAFTTGLGAPDQLAVQGIALYPSGAIAGTTTLDFL